MSQFMGIKPSGGKVAFCCIFALFMGILQPVIQVFQIMMPMASVSLAVIAAAVMYGCAGLLPVIVLGGTSLVSTLFLYGWVPGVLMLAYWLVPAVVILAGMRRREPFFRQITRGIVAALAAAALAVAGMTMLFGSEMIALAIDQLRATFAAQEQMFWEQFPANLKTGMNFEDFVEWYYSMFNALQLYYEYYLLANLFTGAIVTAVISVLWGNWKVTRRGLASSESFRGMSQWYLPANTTWGLLLMLAAGFVISKTGLYGAKSAWIIVSAICKTAFLIQFMASLDRRLINGNSGYMGRGIRMALLLIFGYLWGIDVLLAILGGASALFGSKGAAKLLMNKLKDKTDGEGR